MKSKPNPSKILNESQAESQAESRKRSRNPAESLSRSQKPKPKPKPSRQPQPRECSRQRCSRATKGQRPGGGLGGPSRGGP